MPTPIRVGATPPPVPNRARSGRRRRLGWFTVALSALTLTAGTAQAGNEFEDAFEDELGRIAAQHVATLGRLVVWGGHTPLVERVRVERVHVVKHAPRRHFHGPKCGHHVRPHRHHKHHRFGKAAHRGHGRWRKHAAPRHREHHPKRHGYKHHDRDRRDHDLRDRRHRDPRA